MTKNIYTTYRLRLKINEKWFAWLFKSSGKESYYAFPKFNLKTGGLLGSLYRDVVLNGRTFKSQFFVVHGWISLPQSLLLQFDSFHCVPVPCMKSHKDPGLWLFRCLFNCPVLQQRNLAKTPHREALYKHSLQRRLQAQSESSRLLFGSDKTEIPLCNKLNHAFFQFLPNFKWLKRPCEVCLL